MTGSHAEKILGAKLREGLWGAVCSSDAVTAEDIDSIRFQKLILDGIQHFDLEDQMTVEWFLDGDLAATSTVERASAQADQNPVLKGANEFHVQSYPRIEQIQAFYEDRLEEYQSELDRGTFGFLREYYKNHENIPYRALYLLNLDIDQSLMRAKHDVEYDRDARADRVAIFRQNCREFKTELLTHEEFAGLTAYVDAFESAGVSLLRQIVDGEIEEDVAADAIDELDAFYYNDLWRAVALVISYHNVSGNSEDDVRERRKSELSDIAETFRSDYERLVEWMEERGVSLPPLPDELPEVSIEAEHSDRGVESVEFSYDSIRDELDLAAEPSDIEIEALIAEDDPSEPLSKLVVKERRAQ